MVGRCLMAAGYCLIVRIKPSLGRLEIASDLRSTKQVTNELA